MMSSLSSNGMNALFMALTVNHWRSSRVHPKASQHNCISLVMDVPDIKRLSVLMVTRNPSERSMPIGCASIDGATPVWMFEVGHSSRGMRRSRT